MVIILKELTRSAEEVENHSLNYHMPSSHSYYYQNDGKKRIFRENFVKTHLFLKDMNIFLPLHHFSIGSSKHCSSITYAGITHAGQVEDNEDADANGRHKAEADAKHPQEVSAIPTDLIRTSSPS